MTEKKSTNNNDTSPIDDSPSLDKATKETTTDQTSSKTEKVTVKAAELSKPVDKSTNKIEKKFVSTPNKTTSVTKISKIAVVAFILSLIALGGLAAGYFWSIQQQQSANQALRTQTEQQITAELHAGQKQLSEQLSIKLQQHRQDVESSLIVQLSEQNEAQQEKISLLAEQVAQLSTNKPSDWLAQESEYLIRIAARTLWLEQDVATAISLLRDADTRLIDLKNPQYLPVRQAIHQDIEALNLLPIVETESIVLTLMGLSKQINQLPIAMVHLPENIDKKTTATVSNDAADWQSNLAIIWQDFLDKFFTVSRRTSSVEALLTPDQQQNLRQNLSLKLQMAQWAVTQQSNQVYQEALNDLEQWINTYFDLDTEIVKHYLQSIVQLRTKAISSPEMIDLESLPKIRQVLQQQNNRTRLTPLPDKKTKEEIKVETKVETPTQLDNKEPLL